MTPDPILQLESRLYAWTREGAAMARELAALKAAASAPPAPPEPLPSLGEVAKEAFLQRANKNNAGCWDAAAAAVLAEHERRTKREPTEAEVEEVARMMRCEWQGEDNWDGVQEPGRRGWLRAARAVLRRERGLD